MRRALTLAIYTIPNIENHTKVCVHFGFGVTCVFLRVCRPSQNLTWYHLIIYWRPRGVDKTVGVMRTSQVTTMNKPMGPPVHVQL